MLMYGRYKRLSMVNHEVLYKMGSLYTEQAKKHLASQVKGALAEHFSTADAEIQQGFVDVFWAQLIMQDWADKEVSDIAGCCDSLWGLMSKRLDKPICHIVNPTMEEHGWVSKGTAILMPFTPLKVHWCK